MGASERARKTIIERRICRIFENGFIVINIITYIFVLLLECVLFLVLFWKMQRDERTYVFARLRLLFSFDFWILGFVLKKLFLAYFFSSRHLKPLWIVCISSEIFRRRRRCCRLAVQSTTFPTSDLHNIVHLDWVMSFCPKLSASVSICVCVFVYFLDNNLCDRR